MLSTKREGHIPFAAQTGSGQEAHANLTKKEIEIIRWGAMGKTSWEIAQILNCAIGTVNFHFNNIRKKFAVSSRLAAIVKAINMGIIPTQHSTDHGAGQFVDAAESVAGYASSSGAKVLPTAAITPINNKSAEMLHEFFLGEMEKYVPWELLKELIEKHCPILAKKYHGASLGKYLRIYLVQKWFGYHDAMLNHILCADTAVRHFVRLNDWLPGDVSILEFRNQLERTGMDGRIETLIDQSLAQQGLMIRPGTIISAALLQISRSRCEPERRIRAFLEHS